MHGHSEIFLHWAHRMVDGELANRAASALLRRLSSAGDLPTRRACLYRQGPVPALRQALLIDLGCSSHETDPLVRLRGLWLVEDQKRKVFLYGTDRCPHSSGVGGSSLRDLPVLDPGSLWFERVAKTAAARVLGVDPAAAGSGSSAIDKDVVLLAKVEHAILRAALAGFLEGLDDEVLAVMRAEGAADVETYNHFWNADGAFRRNRIQAARSFPFFAGPIRGDWRLRRAVDRGDPLGRELAARYDVQPRTIQQVRALVPSYVPPEQRAVLLKRLDQLPAEYLPKTDGDWAAFLELSEPLSDLATVLEVDFPHLAAPFSSGWENGRTLLSSKLGAEFDVAAIYEMMQATYRYGVCPQIRDELIAAGRRKSVPDDPPAVFFPTWFGRYPLARLAGMAGDWRDAYRQFSLERLGLRNPALASKLSWTGLFETAVGYSHGRYRVLELTSRQALELEGREQEHCVASYAVKCLMGVSAIFSIRDRHSGKALSTFEIGLVGDTPALLRHHARGNERPQSDLQALATRFVEQVLLAVPTSRIAAVRKARRELGAKVRGLLDAPNTIEDALSDEESEELAEAVVPLHPAEVRREGLLAFVERTTKPCALIQ